LGEPPRLFALRAETHARTMVRSRYITFTASLRWFRYYALRGRLKPFLSRARLRRALMTQAIRHKKSTTEIFSVVLFF
jgi:hypothetical protein